MTLNQMRYVLAVADTHSINQAAADLMISQSALSLSIKKLEQELGQQLFLRTPKGILLTGVGNDFVNYVRPICVQVARLADTLTHAPRAAHSLSVCTSGFYFTKLALAQIYRRFRADGITLQVFDLSMESCLNRVYDGSFELAAIRRFTCFNDAITAQLEAMELKFQPIITLDLGVTVGQGSPLFQLEDSTISIEQLQDLPPIAIKESGLHDILHRLGLPSPKSLITTNSRATLYELMDSTDCWYLNSIYTLKSATDNSTSYPRRNFLLKGCPFQSELGFVSRRGVSLSTEALAFIDLFQEHVVRHRYGYL